ncbi:MAG: ComEC/Rec2-related protein [Rhizobium sp.]|nr:ComEC/Rec2-related protein [Rhizobium sp.]
MAGARDIDKTGMRTSTPRPVDFDLLPSAIGRERDDGVHQAPQAGHWRAFTALLAKWRLAMLAAIEEEGAFGHLFYWAPIFIGAGAAGWFASPTTPSQAYLIVISVILSGAWLIAGPSRPTLRAPIAAMALIATGASLAAWESGRAGTIILDSSVTTTVTGMVTEREADANGRWRYTIQVAATESPALQRAPDIVKLTALGKREPFALGEIITGRARLSPPSGPALSGLNDFAFSAYFEGTGAIGFFYGQPVSEGMWTGDTDLGETVTGWLNGLRGRIAEHIRSVLPGDTGAFAASMVTDDRRAMSKETAEALRLAGLTHIIAISGLNMALAAGLFFVGIRALLSLNQEIAHRYPVKKIAAAGALLTVTGYYLISGFAVSAERAYIMMAIMLMAVFFGRPSISLRNVALSAIVILILSPSAVMGPGFQMSYAATLALVAGYSLWQRRQAQDLPFAGIPFLKPALPVWTFISGVFMTSLIGGFSTALFSIEHFHRIATWGLPANLLAMPIISFIVMPAGLAALVLMPLGLDWLPLQIMGIGLDLVIAIAKWIASFEGDAVVGRIPGWLFVGLTVAFVILAVMRSKLRYAGAGLAVLLMLVYMALPARPKPDLVIFEDGTLAGLLSDGSIATTRTRPAAFILEQWQRALPADRHLGPVMKEAPKSLAKDKRWRLKPEQMTAARKLMKADLLTASASRFACRKGLWCIARARNGAVILQTEIAGLAGAACDMADIVITGARLRWSECRSGAKIFSATSLRRTGSVEIWFDPVNSRKLRVITAFGIGGRSWYSHRLYDWRSGQYIR